MKQTIFYKPKTGVNTRDTLRQLNDADIAHLLKVMQCYLKLAKADPRWQFEDWFNKPTKLLPLQGRDNGYKPNSPKSWCEGIIDKLTKQGRDLSPKQCEGIETLSIEIAKWYDGQCPTIEFKNKLDKEDPNLNQFNKLFKR